MQGDLFYPTASKGTYALILKAWRAHQKTDPVFFAILHDDDHASQKSKLLGSHHAKDNVERVTRDLSRFLRYVQEKIDHIPKEICVSTINMSPGCDFAAEAYLESGIANIGLDKSVEGLLVALVRRSFRQATQPIELAAKTREFDIDDLFTIERGKCPPLKCLESGDIPVVTTTEQSNGIAGYYQVDETHIRTNAITISANGSGGSAFWHPYRFAAVADILICKWRDDFDCSDSDYSDSAFCLYVCHAINHNSWRFDYYRKCSQSRLQADVRVGLPMKGNKVDFALIQRAIKKVPGYSQLMEMLEERNKGYPGLLR